MAVSYTHLDVYKRQEYLIASGSSDAIAWAASFGDLLLGTSGSEYKASGNGSAITPGNITITAQSYWGLSLIHI